MSGSAAGAVERTAWLVLGLALLGAGARAEQAELAPEEVRERWHARLDARHFTARLRLEMELHGMGETRELTVYRLDDEGERVLLRFDRPPDLRDVRLLYREVPDRSNEYFLYTPSTRRVRRLPPLVADDDLYGVDLEYLGFGTSEVEPTEILDMRRVQLGDRSAYLLKERARAPGARFDVRLTWLDAGTFIPLRQELQRAGELVSRAETLAIREIQGVPTPVEMSFARPGDQRAVRLHFERVDYETPLGEEVFAILNLTRRRRDAE
jgi:hypothetical protein